ncbi:MAG: hypothetical protein KGJ32_03135 [Xanthomonadaceae bacterium]|nr:hypothetical protein [Xanthomonadaceae bacterium]
MAGIVLVLVSAPVWADNTLEDEYQQLIKVNQDIQPLGANPFGENISLYDGSLSFEQTDIRLAGDGPLLQLSRSLKVTGTSGYPLNAEGAFADWELDIPRIETVTANQQNVTGWQVPAVNPLARCSAFQAPPVVRRQQGASDWLPDTWWYGYQLIVPGQGSQEMLPRSVQNTLSPSVSGTTFPIVTKQNWMFSCGVLTDDDGGEGFTALAPDGTTYTFNHIVYRPMEAIRRPIGSGPLSPAHASIGPLVAIDDFLARRDALMLVTKVRDRFGNTLTYTYSGANLTSITASDGRQLTLQYVAGTAQVAAATLRSATGATRTWTYQYVNTVNGVADPSLSKVVLPDGSAWSYNLGVFEHAQVLTSGGDCTTLATLDGGSATGTITHPSGLQGTFTVQATVHGRSYVPRQCYRNAVTGTTTFAVTPFVYYQLAATGKTFSGAGLPTRTWTYTYSPPNESWLQDCGGGCVSTVWTDVLDPAGHDVRYTFSNRYDVTEGQLLRTDYYTGGNTSTILRSETNAYAAPTTGAWPATYVASLQDRTNQAQTTELSPLNQRTTIQEGDTYTWQAQAFNAFAQVTQAKRFNTIAGQSAITEQTTYLNDLPHWVLGLPLQVTNLTTGEIESANTYNLGNVTLQSRARFGQTLMNYTFNAQGQLASFTDGNTHTTTLGSYKRGIPQTIGYPDGRSETLVVDDFGQIGAITDQAGHTTGYTYDPVGRITAITYPAGDEVAWYPTTFAYTYVTAAERGIAANHWRRTVTTGNASTVTWFDAMLRPLLSDTSIIGTAGSDITTAKSYDERGLTTFTSYPVGGAPALSTLTAGTHQTYDALGRLTQTQQNSELGMLTTTTAYLSGARQQMTDPKGNVTTTRYQVFDEPGDGAAIQVQAPGGLTQTIARDLYGNPTAITQSGLYGTQSLSVTKTLTYDSYHRLCRRTEPESGSTVLAYDAANNLAWSADGLSITGTGCGQEQVAAAARTTRSYDAMNRVLTMQPPSGTQSTQTTYDALGQATQVVSGTSVWNATYDFRGLLTGETLQLSGQSPWHLGYLHDAYGTVRQLIYPDGTTLAYGPDALGRATQVGSYASHLSYFPNGAVAGFTYGNGAGHVAEQNARQLPSNFTDGTAGTLNLSEDFSYDADGNITQVNDLTGGPRSKTFGYDGLNRLTSATATRLWGTETYSYDPLNNLRTRVGNGQTVTYTYDPANRLASLSGVGSFVYDNRGNLISKAGVSLVFDQKNQLAQVAGVASYAYDAAGRRVQKTPSGGSPTYYFYNQAGQLLYQWEPGKNKATDYIVLGRTTIARRMQVGTGTPTVIYSYTDPQGTPLVRADAQGTVTSTFDYTSYGTVALGPQPDGTGYTGHVNDPDTGLVYMQARYYDPVAGRFLSVDPLAPSAGGVFDFNRYAYANNNPIVNIDPDGRQYAPSACQNPAECAARRKMADAVVARDSQTIVHLLGGPIASLADLVHGIFTGDHKEASEGAAMAILGAVIPEANGARAVVTASEEAQVVSSVTRGALARGRASEARILMELGLPKNTQAVRTAEGASIPDALTSTRSIEIKDAIRVERTRQVRIQTGAARETGLESVLITGERTCVSGPCTRAFDRIIRRPDLGPQQ